MSRPRFLKPVGAIYSALLGETGSGITRAREVSIKTAVPNASSSLPIEAAGRIALHGLHFDTGSDTVLALDEETDVFAPLPEDALSS